MITDLLLKYGLSEKEIAVYTVLIQKGHATAIELSKITKINRTTIYSVCKELQNKGFINEDASKTKNGFIPLPPQNLKSLIARDEQHLQHRKNLIDQLIPELFSISRNTIYSPPKIIFKSEDEFEEYLYQQSPVWTSSILKYDGIWWGFQDPTFVEHYQKYIDWHWKQEYANKMGLKMITTQTSFESQAQSSGRWPQRRKIKIWPNSDRFTAGMWICGDYVILAATQQSPHYLIEIFDKVMAHNFRELLKGFWETLPDLP